MGPIFHHILVFLIYCSLFCSSLLEGIKERSYFVNVSTLMLIQPCTCKDAAKGALERRKGSLEVHHRLSPCSQQQVDSEKLEAPTFSQMLSRDRNRAIKMKKHMFQPNAMTDLPTESGDTFNIRGQYLIKIGLGSQNQKVSVIFDTGSVLTWIQCLPCQKGGCYAQKEPIFDTRKSTSYTLIKCPTQLCKQLNVTGGVAACSKNGICRYGVIYGSKQYTVGNFSTDVLTLTKNDVFPSFNFGCSQKFSGSFGTVAGILGLGRGGNISLVSQTAQEYNGLFSYCLPSTNCLPGYLTFGNGTSGHASCEPRSATIFTPIIKKPFDPSLYFVNLTGISVGSQRLIIEPTIFSRGPGTIIDSGTTLTYLPLKVYATLKSQVMKEMAIHRYPKLDRDKDGLLCYDLSKYIKVHIPKISLFFEAYKNEKEEVEVPVHETGIFLSDNNVSEVCLAFFDDSQIGISIFGNTQQKTYMVTYDTNGEKLGLHSKGCE